VVQDRLFHHSEIPGLDDLWRDLRTAGDDPETPAKGPFQVHCGRHRIGDIRQPDHGSIVAGGRPGLDPDGGAVHSVDA